MPHRIIFAHLKEEISTNFHEYVDIFKPLALSMFTLKIGMHFNVDLLFLVIGRLSVLGSFVYTLIRLYYIVKEKMVDSEDKDNIQDKQNVKDKKI